MSNRIQFGAKTLATLMMVSTVLSISGFAALAPAVAQAVAPADYGLHEGDAITANAAAGDPDIYIVNDWGYKRLFVNPAIFNLYGQLGWSKVKQVSAATRDAFVTSGLFRNCETNDQKVYGLDVTGEDTAVLHWVNVTGAQAVAQDPNFFQKVFCINNAEQALYGTGSDFTSLSQIPNYARGATGTGTGTTSGLSVSLASDNPSSGTLIETQSMADLGHFSIMGSGVVHTITLSKLGIAGDSTLTNIYLFVNGVRVTDASTFGSGVVTFNDANGLFTAPAVVQVRADIADATSGQTVGVAMTGLETGTVNVSGNLFSIAANPGDLAQVDMGGALLDSGGGIDPQADVRVWEDSNVQVNNKDVTLTRLTLREIGSVNYSDIQNFRLYVGGVQVATAANLDANGYVTFLTNTALPVGTRDLKVLADVVGGATRTFSFQLKGAYDIQLTDSNYHVGIAATGAVLGKATTTCTVSAAPHVDVTKATNSPSGDVVQGSTGVAIAKYQFQAYGEAIKVDQLGVNASVDGNSGYLRNGRLLINGVQYGSTKSIILNDDHTATTSFTVNYT
ncbi:MAG TPA: hypothetical protein VMU12_02825, partial [Candidatus Paceibacterota bacterium]|nr:hypothetical protein [Candidatus Paceibacterota bacterium]